jgi:hypothetical protein
LEQFATGRAALGGIGRVYKHHLATSVYRFVRQQLLEDTPSRIQNTFAQVAVSYQVANFQIFASDTVIGLYQCMAQLVSKIGALILDMLMLALDTQQRLATALVALLLSRQRTLQQAQLLSAFAIELRMIDLFAIRSGDEGCYADINPNRLSSFRQRRLVSYFTGKTGQPLSRFVDDANGLNVAFKRTMPAHRNAPDAEQLQAPAIQFRTDPKLLESETMEAIASFKAWVAGCFACLNTAKEGLKGFIYRVSYRLKGLRENCFSLWECGAITDCRLSLSDFLTLRPSIS